MSSICGSLRTMMRSIKTSPVNKMAQMARGYWEDAIAGSRSYFSISIQYSVFRFGVDGCTICIASPIMKMMSDSVIALGEVIR